MPVKPRFLIPLLTFAAACGWVDSPRSASAEGAADCAGPGTDSARAVCAALEAVAARGVVSRPMAVTRRDGLFCVITTPREAMIDGGGAVLVDGAGTVRDAVLGDSVACRWAQVGMDEG